MDQDQARRLSEALDEYQDALGQLREFYEQVANGELLVRLAPEADDSVFDEEDGAFIVSQKEDSDAYRGIVELVRRKMETHVAALESEVKQLQGRE